MQNILRTPCNQIFKIYEKRTATFLNSFNVFSQTPTKNLCITSVSMICQSKELRMAEGARMRQVEVDEVDVQKRLGKINMDFVRKAEKRNKERATMHR